MGRAAGPVCTHALSSLPSDLVQARLRQTSYGHPLSTLMMWINPPLMNKVMKAMTTRLI